MCEELERLKESSLEEQKKWFRTNVGEGDGPLFETSLGYVYKRHLPEKYTIVEHYIWNNEKEKIKANSLFLDIHEIAYLKLREELG